jgi:DNA-binding NarL/FixJ family response regulator
MELVEREEFLNELTTVFTEVTAGKGQFVLVSGEAEIGKTSLGERFAETQKEARLLTPSIFVIEDIHIRRGPRPSTTENPYGLTKRELEILTLMAQGLGNAQISQRLFISSRTVDHHVSAIFAKLEVHSRSEASAIAFQSGLVDQNR